MRPLRPVSATASRSGLSMPMSREVTARMRSSSVIILRRDERAHARDQRHVRYRLGEEIVGAGLEPLDPVGRLIQRRDHHHRHVVGGEAGLQAPAHFEAVHVGHHHVEQDDVAVGALADRQRLVTAHRGDDVEILGREPRLQQLDVGRHIIDDENARSHRLLLRRCPENGGRSRGTCPPRSAWRDRPRSRPRGSAPRRPSSRKR